MTASGASAGPPRVQLGATSPLGLLLLERLDLLVVILSLFVCLLVYDEPMTIEYGAIAVVAVILASRCITPPDLRGSLAVGMEVPLGMTRLTVEWCTVVGILLLLGFALKVSDWFSRGVLLSWFVATPVALIVMQELQSRVAHWFSERGAFASRYVYRAADFQYPADPDTAVGPTRFDGHDLLRTGRIRLRSYSGARGRS